MRGVIAMVCRMEPRGIDSFSPDQARTVADLLRLLRQLRAEAGCSYRELERRAAANSDSLPRSTVADLLSKSALPRADLLAAFVRACGDEDRLDLWLRARARLAEAHRQPVAAPPPPSPRPFRRWTSLVGGVFTVLAVAAAVLKTGFGTPELRKAESAGPAASPPPIAVVGGRVRIRPVRTPDLCVTEGRDRAGLYDSAVAVQRPCADAEPPRTYLEPVRDDTVQIQWHHPKLGRRCLTVLGSGPVRHMLEPQNTCSDERFEQAFHVEPVGLSASAPYRLRTAHSNLCLGLMHDDQAAGTEIVQEPCTGGADQQFLIDTVES